MKVSKLNLTTYKLSLTNDLQIITFIALQKPHVSIPLNAFFSLKRNASIIKKKNNKN